MGLLDNMKNKINETMEGHDSGADSRDHPHGASNTSGSKYGSENDYDVPRTDRSGDRSGIDSGYNERSDDTYGVGFDSSSNKKEYGNNYNDDMEDVDAAGRRSQGSYTRSGNDRSY